MNIAITNVSFITMRDNALVIRDYVDESGNQFKGCMTNEPPLKSLMLRMQARGERLDRVIYIESDSVSKKTEIPYGDGKRIFTTGDFLRYLINEYSEVEQIESPCFDRVRDVIAIKDNPNDKAVAETVFAVYGRLLELYQERAENENMNVFIESNGGVRYVLTMLLSLTKTLENSLEHFNIEEISSMVLKDSPVRISDTRFIYDTFQITSIIEEYVNYGRVNGMKKYICGIFEKCNDTALRQDTENLVQKLVALAEDIQLCRTRGMLDDFYKDGGIGNAIDAFVKKYEASTHVEGIISTFVMQRIGREFDECIYKGYNSGEDSILSLPKVIEWCLRKDFIQQALTLCSERMPEYLFRSGKLKLSEEFDNLLDSAGNERYERSYYFVAHLKQEFLCHIDNIKVNEILSQVCRGGRLLSEQDTNAALRKTKVGGFIADRPEFNDIANRTYRLAREVGRKDCRDITERYLKERFTAYGLNPDDVHKRIAISSNGRSTILGMLQGKSYRKGTDELVNNPNLQTREARLIKLLPILADLYLDQRNDEETYRKLLAETFPDDNPAFLRALEDKYVAAQSRKYYIGDAMESGHISTEMSNNDTVGQARLQKILYLYSLCKEQRNFSNHAHVAEDDVNVAMNIEQLKVVIGKLLEEVR